jgi:AcrR family transcriptional regulator
VSPRQQIGKRKQQDVTRQRGRDRREAILQATYDLLCERPVENISFRDIADKAGIPEGSAYHFFANRFDIFSALAKKLSGLFIDAHRRPIPAAKRTSREALAAYFVDVGVRVYRRNPPALQLLIGGKTPPEVKQSDRINDRDVANVMYEVFTQHFALPDSTETRDAFYYFIEITDLILTLSMIEHGRITAAMIREAKRAGISYLSTYF